MSEGSSYASSKKMESDRLPDKFPVGMKVLLVDGDLTCLVVVKRMLLNFQYNVTTCAEATRALSLLRENKGVFDLIISEVHMPDMDGFRLLELVGLEMDLPVIMMSADTRFNVVMKGVSHGACDFLSKPVRMEELQNIWQHVVRRKWLDNKDIEHSGSVEESEDDDGELDSVDPSSSKKPRVWSIELHQQFVNAVNQLGIDKAVPKRILELMNVPGLTRENVASHLQGSPMHEVPTKRGLEEGFIVPNLTLLLQEVVSEIRTCDLQVTRRQSYRCSKDYYICEDLKSD